MSGIQGMTEISLTELRKRVPPSVNEIGDEWFAEKWNENWLGCQSRYTLQKLEAHRKFLGVEKLEKEHLVFLVSRDTAMPREFSRCCSCHKTIQLPVRWYGLTEGGVLEQDSDLSVREYGFTAILFGLRGPFVAKFCTECRAKTELPEKSRWASYAKSLAHIAVIVERRNAREVKERAKNAKAKKAAEASAGNIASMLRGEEVGALTN